jgi:hypothetical protein
MNRFNPIHVMLRTGTDAYAGVLDHRKIRASDDLIILPTQCGTQWDGLGHIFYEKWMYNGFDIREVTSAGAQKCGIEKTREKMVGRGVLLDIPKLLGKKWLADGFEVTAFAKGNWDGYPGGDAPGLGFDTLQWLHEKEVAGVATDTWGAEVRPNRSKAYNQPWHWISIPIMGLTVGEIFDFTELAKDCAKDGRYEFMFVAPALPITGAVGSPCNPLAIK